MPILSVIVPVYNTHAYLSACIESILAQSFEDFELILINDGSTDESGVLCDEYSRIDRRIKVLHKANEGLALTRNVGLALAHGEFISFVDSDDMILSDMYQTMVNTLLQNKADFVMCPFRRFYNNNIDHFRDDNLPTGILDCQAEVYNQILYPMLGARKGSPAITASSCRIIYRRSIIERYELTFLSERVYLSEDLLFNVEYFSRCTNAILLNTPLYLYRDNLASLTTLYNSRQFQLLENMNLYLKTCCYYLGLDMSECLPRLAYRMVEYTSVCIKKSIQALPQHEALSYIRMVGTNSYFCQNLTLFDSKTGPFFLKFFAILMRARRYRTLRFLINLYIRFFPNR